MNRPEKRRQRKLSEKAAKNTKPVQSESSPPEQQTLTVQHAIDRALRHHSAGRLPEAGRYSTGPWAVSLTYFNGQEEGPTLTPGDEENEFIAAAVSYQRGPGIKTSLTFITAEMQDDSPAGANIAGNDTDGRAVLLGIHAGF